MVLQFGGSSCVGFMSMEQRLRARDELSKIGRFEGPNYRHCDGKLEWGLNVIWQHVFGERLKYPLPRYPKVVVADPGRFNWIPIADATGVENKFLGAFTERAVWIEMVRLRPHARWRSTHANARRLVFVTTGSGFVQAQPFGRYDSLQFECGETADISAVQETRLFVVGLPPVQVPSDCEAEFELVDGAADDRV